MYMLMSFINLLFDLKVTQFSTITFNEHLMIYSYSLEKKSEYMCVLICGKWYASIVISVFSLLITDLMPTHNVNKVR